MAHRKGFIRFVWREHPLLSTVSVAALCALIFFAVQFVAGAMHMGKPPPHSREIEPWMSIRYVERSWHLSKPVMFEIIGYDLDTPPKELPHSVGEFLRDSGMSLAEFQSRIEDAQAQPRRRGDE